MRGFSSEILGTRPMFKHVPAWLRPAPDSVTAGVIRQGKSPWADSVHLLWSVWVFITPVFDQSYGWRWALFTLASYPVFLLLYTKTLVAPRRTSPRYALGLAVMSLLLMRWYPSGISYFIYGCVMLRCGDRFLAYLGRLVALNAVFLVVCWALDYPWSVMLTLPFTTFIIGIIINVEHMSAEKDAALKLSHDEIRRLAATAERERIGRDLHDLLGHTLSLITLKLELSRRLFDRDAPAAKREIEEAEKVARLALAEVRSAVTGIRATDLAAELASARLLLESSNVHLDYGEPPADLPEEIERGLALALREAVTNVARHAQASRAQIEFVRSRSALQLSVSDDGRGCSGADGNGRCGMRERVAALGGTLSIESSRGNGTRLRISVPLPSAARATVAPEPTRPPSAEPLRSIQPVPLDASGSRA
jgi:two-component system sensor histidine kinase DesK